ncbi:carbamoyltransferase HypF [Parageobacillus thermoglucosidasius]|uniref:Carbamoyltransferase n=2 Tax=Parageobacillus thermoglucosidasius TaxID=1426 RepID=A0AAN0YPU0_PARTM|nr:carbamoyltransferase HypF [Parageobacillus thermoglucosidasius]AEH48028.1 Acylphosphatase [Parageobacillus thermoglucosidasius C56-YS93]ALF10738.1 carbamoyltransferase HypF [Parageobacillus thermoglucosidasius]ANZ30816.1 carbamoyltransferase HypF [Parageobacillus thermoglucosidasius]APM81553.1 carbamoyltransferase HypF [Parageobacillus thermoglucosidasius]KJX69386.1 acylphosphatase [Parageobacillus thermoglucosidasius]
MKIAQRIHIYGVVQGVGFRPFVFRAAKRWGLSGWVRNGESGVDIHVEGDAGAVQQFVREIMECPPASAKITNLEIKDAAIQEAADFNILESMRHDRPTVHIPADLAVCSACLSELFDPVNRRYLYPYINCTDCGPRYTVIERLPYDRPYTTMRAWLMCPDCSAEYHNPADRRFHAQPTACPGCGPHYYVRWQGGEMHGDEKAIEKTAELLRTGRIVAIKGLGGYHLACDAENEEAVRELRKRKRRSAKPFALMVKDIETAKKLIDISAEEEKLLTSSARPIVLARARRSLPGVAPDNSDLGIMLPYTPLHHLLFHFGAPHVLVMTSANRSSEPIIYEDDKAAKALEGIADVWLVGERPIARRVDDSVVRVTPFGPAVLRRARGYAPLPVAQLPSARPILAVGSDLKNAVTLVVNGQAVVSQHLGDLVKYEVYMSFEQTVYDLLSMYDVPLQETIVAYDLHPDYRSSAFAYGLEAYRHIGIQHHRAHVASVLAERNALDKRVIGVALDGTGFGDDGAIWGGELFVGSAVEGLERRGHLRYAMLPGGDAAARMPLQALAGFFADEPELAMDVGKRLSFPERFFTAVKMVEKRLRTFPTTSVGRLFDAAAALLGFTETISFEGQAAIWLEHLARTAPLEKVYSFPWDGKELDYLPLLKEMAADRLNGRDVAMIARSFHRSVAEGIFRSVRFLGAAYGIDTVVLSGGAFQNSLLLADLQALFLENDMHVWIGKGVPPNDGGISLGQAALAAVSNSMR